VRYPVFDPPVGIVTLAGWVRGICRNTIYCSAIGERRKERSDERSGNGDGGAKVEERNSKSEEGGKTR